MSPSCPRRHQPHASFPMLTTSQLEPVPPRKHWVVTLQPAGRDASYSIPCMHRAPCTPLYKSCSLTAPFLQLFFLRCINARLQLACVIPAQCPLTRLPRVSGMPTWQHDKATFRPAGSSFCHALLTRNYAAWAVPKSRCMGCLSRMQAVVHLEPREATNRLPLL